MDVDAGPEDATFDEAMGRRISRAVKDWTGQRMESQWREIVVVRGGFSVTRADQQGCPDRTIGCDRDRVGVVRPASALQSRPAPVQLLLGIDVVVGRTWSAQVAEMPNRDHQVNVGHRVMRLDNRRLDRSAGTFHLRHRASA